MYVGSKYCSLAKSARLICITKSRKFHFAMITSVRAKLFTDSSGKKSLDLSKGFPRAGCWAYRDGCAVTRLRVAAGKLPLIVTSFITSE